MTMFNGNMVREAYVRFNMCVCPLDNFKRLEFFFALNDFKMLISITTISRVNRYHW
jgi:hypothetical protein